MTQWGGILGPQPPQDSLTGDTNSHTQTHFHTGYATVYASYRYQTFQQFICSPLIDLLSVFALICSYVSSENTFVHVSVHLVLKFLLYFSTDISTWTFLTLYSFMVNHHYFIKTFVVLLSIFLLFSVIRNSPSFHVLHVLLFMFLIVTFN